MINTSIIDCKIKLYIDINYLQVKCLPTKFFVLKKNCKFYTTSLPSSPMLGAWHFVAPTQEKHSTQSPELPKRSVCPLYNTALVTCQYGEANATIWRIPPKIRTTMAAKPMREIFLSIAILFKSRSNNNYDQVSTHLSALSHRLIHLNDWNSAFFKWPKIANDVWWTVPI